MTSPTQPTATDVKVFVPTRELKKSLQFYQALGWKCSWESDGLAEIELAGVRLYLQSLYVKEWAENFMIYIVVEDVAAWYAHIEHVISSGAYPGTRVNPPKAEPYGALVTYAWDPCGVLLHFAQPANPVDRLVAT